MLDFKIYCFCYSKIVIEDNYIAYYIIIIKEENMSFITVYDIIN